MKRILYIVFVLPILLVSRGVAPEAHFSVDKLEAVVGEEVLFTNESS